MEALINFFVNNYLWFLIISFVLIFALIGYLVDTSEQKENNKIDLNNNPSNDNINLNVNEDALDELNR